MSLAASLVANVLPGSNWWKSGASAPRERREKIEPSPVGTVRAADSGGDSLCAHHTCNSSKTGAPSLSAFSKRPGPRFPDQSNEHRRFCKSGRGNYPPAGSCPVAGDFRLHASTLSFCDHRLCLQPRRVFFQGCGNRSNRQGQSPGGSQPCCCQCFAPRLRNLTAGNVAGNTTGRASRNRRDYATCDQTCREIDCAVG